MKAKLPNFIALDLGSSKIASIAAHIDKKGAAQIISQNLHRSQGIKSGIILDIEDAEDSIIGAIYNLEKDCNKNIKQVTISLTGSGTRSYFVNHKLKLYNQPITRRDIKKLVQKALSEFRLKDQEIIHYFPIKFILDNNNSIQDPIGMFGKELCCEIHIITANSNMLMNITSCFAKCHIEITNIVLSIYAAGIACLSDDEKNLGGIIIDIGSRTTTFGIFLSGKLIYTNHIDIGSFHITSDIAKIFSISLNSAEKLKVLYGNAIPSSLDKESVINMEDLEFDNSYNAINSITTRNLAEVIYPRAKEILLMVKNSYDKVVNNNIVAHRFVITGGGSTLRGMKELASKIFDKQVRIGSPLIIEGFSENYNPSMYSTTIGMIMNQSLKQQKNSFYIDNDKEDSSQFRRIFTWLKENI